MKKRSGFYPRLGVDEAGARLVSQAGGVVLVDTVRATGLDRLLSAALTPWRKPNAVHDPAKVVCDPAVTLALGGDCLAGRADNLIEPDSALAALELTLDIQDRITQSAA